jgi:hypothetical protein
MTSPAVSKVRKSQETVTRFVVYRLRGDLARAEAMHDKALALAETLDHKEGIAMASAHLQ